jgi:protein-S-isoprenylcysteine O-methyltransferase Ste14
LCGTAPGAVISFMLNSPQGIAQLTLDCLIASWCIFGAVFLLRKKQPKQTETRRERLSLAGITLQACGFAVVWARPHASFIAPGQVLSYGFEVAIAVATIAIAVSSIWLVVSAVSSLGKQWAVAARLVEGHRLITQGPYSFVRNPIYLGMFGMMVAAGLALHNWKLLPAAVVLFAVGTVIRVRSEEKLLRAAFGEEFEAYARRVSAVFPGVF